MIATVTEMMPHALASYIATMHNIYISRWLKKVASNHSLNYQPLIVMYTCDFVYVATISILFSALETVTFISRYINIVSYHECAVTFIVITWIYVCLYMHSTNNMHSMTFLVEYIYINISISE